MHRDYASRLSHSFIDISDNLNILLASALKCPEYLQPVKVHSTLDHSFIKTIIKVPFNCMQS